MQAASKLGISITVNKVGSDSPNTGAPTTVSPIDGSKEWQPTFTLDEDGLLHHKVAFTQYATTASSTFICPCHTGVH
uniref:Uncharacterized protein n=1 Tax=Nelumbo nucifera TaxID=4432 RepID=A0A822XM13_NELNU|nr:TPA_asm: hypothetical protein HUJ06_022206 [Nelumbo nucifera]